MKRLVPKISDRIQMLMIPKYHLLILKVLFFLLCISFMVSSQGCGTFPFFHEHPEQGPFPYTFKIQNELPGSGIFLDLNCDGREEYISVCINKKLPPSYIIIYTSDFEIIDQINFNGTITRLTHFDWSGDKSHEIVVSYTSHDTAFLRIMDRFGNTVKEAPLFTGEPRIDSTATYPWKGDIHDITYTDIDNNGKKELIVFAREGYAKSPRGIYVYEGKTLQLRWKYNIGPLLDDNLVLHDFDKDGYIEFLIPSTSSCNGNVANDTDDEHSYLFMIEHNGKLKWRHEYGGRYTGVKAYHTDLDGDGSPELITIFTKRSPSESKPLIEIIDPMTGNPTSAPRYFLSSIKTPCIVQFDRDIEKEFLILARNDQIMLLDHNMNVIKSSSKNIEILSINIVDDLNNNGLKEIFVHTKNAIYWLSKDLELKAKTNLSFARSPVFSKENQVYHDHSTYPYFALYRENRTVLVSLEKNHQYLIDYYGPIVGIGFALLLFSVLVLGNLYQYRKGQFLDRHLKQLLSVMNDPVLVINHKMNIKYANPKAQNLFWDQQRSKSTKRSHGTPQLSELLNKLSFLRTAESVRQTKQIQLTTNNHSTYHVSVEPLHQRGKKRANWMIVLKEASLESDLQNARAWAAMTQRIAHDIKNPLTSIQLTLQRLQRELNQKHPDHAESYNKYTNKITERIEALRSMSRNFMKFVNVEQLNLQPADINAFIENAIAKPVIEIPDDIDLIKNLSPDLPTVRIDQEQLETVVENILSNAINAMPDGGSITVGTSLASGLHIKKGTSPRDYVVLEIMDTGVGIPHEMEENLFKPFITRTYLGSGLGLTIVKKIVDDHNGHIEINSEVDTGTSVALYIPVA